MKTNLHTHSTWCDGRNTPAEMAEAACERGFAVLGFSSHSEMLRDIPAYIADIRALAERFRGRLEIRCGLEADGGDACGFADRLDYVIGSLHFVTAPDGARVAVDHTPAILEKGIADHFGGSSRAFVTAYFEQERAMVANYDFDIVGHPDLVRKFNAKNPYFDETADWYRDEVARTAEALAASGKTVEINTGAIARGWLATAYPDDFFYGLLRARGVRFILSSDAHSADGLDCAFERYADRVS